MQSGVYKIKNIINGKIYVGSSVNIQKRKSLHLCHLRKGIHANKFLQHSFNKHGEENFLFEVIEYCFPEECIDREQYYLDIYSPTNSELGYNICPNSRSVLGVKRSEYTKRKISESKKSNPPIVSKELREFRSRIRKGKTLSRETRDKIGAAGMGRKMSDEAKLKISKGNKGKPKSEKHKMALSLSHRGPRKPHSEEAKINMRIAAKNRAKISEETRKKLSESHRGKIQSLELIAKRISSIMSNKKNKNILCQT